MVLQTETSSGGISSPFLSHSHLAKMIIIMFKKRTFHTLYSCRIFSKPQHITWLWEWVETPLGCWSEQQYCRCWSFVLFFNAVTMLGSVNMHYIMISTLPISCFRTTFTPCDTLKGTLTLSMNPPTPHDSVDNRKWRDGIFLYVHIFYTY